MIISILQIAVAVVLVILILLQERSGGISGILGGGGEGGFYQARRGLEKVIFRATITLTIVFAGLAIIQLIY
ncbi:preprotein translocase subunit SecG [Candidatus Parcubacteria bacterium]|nr:MAG: preprotein translocase subunit SecG [Candidatus Parcubacteria bacterium]